MDAQPKPPQALEIAGIVASLPADDEIRLECEDALDIEASEIADAGQLPRRFGPITEIDRGHQPITGAGDIEKFGDMRRETDDAQHLRIVSSAQRSRQHQQEASAQDRTATTQRGGEDGKPAQLNQPTMVSAANTVTQMIAMR